MSTLHTADTLPFVAQMRLGADAFLELDAKDCTSAVFAFDQSSDKIGSAVIGLRAGIIEVLHYNTDTVMRNSKVPHNYSAADLLQNTLVQVTAELARDKVIISTVVLEGTYRGRWKPTNALAELRGMCIQAIRDCGFNNIMIVTPSEWQGEHGWIGLKREAIKARSVNAASVILRGCGLSTAHLDEHAADAIHIAITARGRILERQLGEKQKSFSMRRPRERKSK